MVGKAFALCRVEHREALQERNRLGFFVGLSRALLLVVGYEAVGIDDGRAALALADIAAEGQSLAERAPALAGEAVLDDGAPKDEDVHAGIAAPGGCVVRHSERRLRRRRAPGLDPGHAPGLQLGDDPGGDFVVKARPVGAGTGSSSLIGHRGPPRRAPGASLPAVNPSRSARPHSLSRGVAGYPRRRGRPRRHARPQGKAFPSRLPQFSCRRSSGLIGSTLTCVDRTRPVDQNASELCNVCSPRSWFTRKFPAAAFRWLGPSEARRSLGQQHSAKLCLGREPDTVRARRARPTTDIGAADRSPQNWRHLLQRLPLISNWSGEPEILR